MIGYLLKVKLKSFLFTIILLFTFITVLYQLNFTKNSFFRAKIYHQPPVILWWTQFYNNSNARTINCNSFQCIVTENRKFIDDPATAVFLFYGSSFSQYDVPLPRKPSHKWGIIHEESPKNLALFLYEDAQELFNFTSTFSRYSHFPITLQYLPNIELLIGKEYFRTVEDKNKLLNKISPVLYIQSDCATPLERDSYVAKLMEYIDIDSYGQCMHNKDLPVELQNNYLQNMYSDEFMRFIAQYKFVIAFENAVCQDYITEKLWKPLIAGSVPIYMGSPTVKDWTPNTQSVILASDFNNPKDLADFIVKLNQNDSLYNSYLAHKLSAKVDNTFLRQQLENREWSVDDSGAFHFFEAFECFICESVHKNTGRSTGKQSDYDCPEPRSPLTGKRNESNWWVSHWREGRCQAQVLRRFVTLANYSKEVFDKEVQRLMAEGRC